MDTIQIIQQKRAKFAIKVTNKFLANEVDVSKQKEWSARANEMPAMIQMNGLGQTVAFYLTKGEIHKRICEALGQWLLNETNIFASYDMNDNKSLLVAITTSDMQTYCRAQAEAQAWLVWLKKLSKVYCSGENNEYKK